MFKRNRKLSFRCEPLEARNMLSGHPLVAPLPPVHLSSPPPPAQVGHSSGPSTGPQVSGQQSNSAGTTLTATLTDPSNATAAGTVTYSTGNLCGTTTTTLSVSVTGAAASTSLAVTIGTTVVGTLMTDASGDGTLVLSSNPTGSQQALPAGFPTSILATTAVSVGTLAGVFAAATTPTQPTPPPGGCGQGGQAPSASLSATLADPSNSGAAGAVTFTSSTAAGVTTTTFSVSVTGAAASTSLNVLIGKVVVGTITTDATGAGTLVLSSSPTGSQSAIPSNFPKCIIPGTTVSVGTLTGSLAPTTTSSSSTASSTIKISASQSALVRR